jgi:hypothetical protein
MHWFDVSVVDNVRREVKTWQMIILEPAPPRDRGRIPVGRRCNTIRADTIAGSAEAKV